LVLWGKKGDGGIGGGGRGKGGWAVVDLPVFVGDGEYERHLSW